HRADIILTVVDLRGDNLKIRVQIKPSSLTERRKNRRSEGAIEQGLEGLRLSSEQIAENQRHGRAKGDEPQPIFSAIDKLHALRDDGLRLLAKFQTDPHEDKRTL